MSRIRVVQLVCGLAIGEHNGGAETFAVRLAGALDPMRFEVSVCSLWSYGGTAERCAERELRERGIPVYFGGPHREKLRTDLIVGFVGISPIIRALRPDILNTHAEYADLVGALLRRTTRTRLLVRTAHNVVEWPFAPHWERYTRRLYPLACDYEVAVSRAIVAILDARPMARALGKRARFIPNAIHPHMIAARRTRRDMRAALGIPASAPLFGTVGRLSDQKGLPHLFAAMELVREQLPDARLVVAGHGERAEAYRALLAGRGQDAYITLLGPRPDAIDIVASLDVFVSSSLWEGLPTVIMEAMLVGTPVVATDIAGSRDLVIDGRTGRLAPPGDSAALARALVEHYRERERARCMAAAARQHVESFTIPRVAAEYGALYEALLRRTDRDRAED
ncbi:MAG TPA: glycosyltransferase [Roseiflexaceae bacterium]|nr:glycosyltransferase [Roseiflexaceae bacterium]